MAWDRLSRRTFLRNGSIGAIAGGLVASVPGLSSLAAGVTSSGAELGGATSVSSEDLAGFSGPIVAHITDVESGEFSLYVGEREVVARDPALVGRLLRAGR